MQIMKLMMLFLLSTSVQATVTAGSDLCPDEFEGRVKAVVDELGPDHAFATKQVIFLNQETLRGEVKNQIVVDILKNGPFEVEPGKEYRVLLRKGKLCWIESI